MAEDEVEQRSYEKIAESVGENLDADVLFFNGEIARPYDQIIIDSCMSRRRRKNVLLMMVTNGGNADAAYRIARCLQTKYEECVFYVSGYCKSAGTLVLLGANEIIFSDHGELGPLDVQMKKEDDLFQLQSGFTVMDALTALQDKAFLSFEQSFVEIERRSEGAITVKTAGEMATNLTSGLFSGLFGQVDPLHVGEAARALSIARAYGIRLREKSQNWSSDTLERLLSGYPSHGFVIDRKEATSLFEELREPKGDEIELAKSIGDIARQPQDGKAIVQFLNKEIEESTVSTIPRREGDEEAKQGRNA